MSEQQLSIGDPAPRFSLPDTTGQHHGLPGEGPAAPATVVYWTCNHCPYALAWHDRLVDVARDYARDYGVRVLAVNSNDAERYPADSREAMAARVEREDEWSHPYLHDESQEIAHAFGALKTPDLFVFDADLRLRYRGAPDPDHDDPGHEAVWLRQALDAILAGESPETAETDPVGCGIKWRP
jgi:hypothetical protein